MRSILSLGIVIAVSMVAVSPKVPVIASNSKSSLSNEAYVVGCILGEAEDQGYEGMLAVAHGIRNRGHLRGVYGCRASRVVNNKVSGKIRNMAFKAWRQSRTGQDITGSATHWENVKAFGKPYWADSMIKTVQIMDHQFYKEKTK